MARSWEFDDNGNALVSKDVDPAAYTTFIGDKWLAERTGMKVPTIRSQRFKRLHGQPHWLDLDPVFIGSKPRYRLSDTLAWLQRQRQRTCGGDGGEAKP